MSVSHNNAYFDKLASVATDPTTPRADIKGCTSAGLVKAYIDKIRAASFSRMHCVDVQPSGGEQPFHGSRRGPYTISSLQWRRWSSCAAARES